MLFSPILCEDLATPYQEAEYFPFFLDRSLATRTWKQPKCPSTDKWLKTLYIYTMECYLVIKKNEIMPFIATWMDLEMFILSDVSHIEKDKYL